MDLVPVAGPLATPLSLAQAKSHLKVEVDDENEDIRGMLEGATSALDGPDGWLGRALVEQTWALVMGRFPAVIEVPLPPLREVVSIEYFDETGVQRTLAPDQYIVVDRGRRSARIHAATDVEFPGVAARPDAVRVTFKAGYVGVTAEDPKEAEPGIPAAILSAIRLMIGDLYEHREDRGRAADLTVAEDLLFRLRVGGVG